MAFFKKIYNKLWKYSSLRFYIKNAIWNYKFWLNCKKIYKQVNYYIKEDDYYFDESFKIRYKQKPIQKKRFAGYIYKNNIYYDNPGFKIDDRETWKQWRKKGLI